MLFLIIITRKSKFQANWLKPELPEQIPWQEDCPTWLGTISPTPRTGVEVSFAQIACSLQMGGSDEVLGLHRGMQPKCAPLTLSSLLTLSLFLRFDPHIHDVAKDTPILTFFPTHLL